MAAARATTGAMRQALARARLWGSLSSNVVFFSCRHRVRLGHRDLASFLLAVAEAWSPQRFREENAVARFTGPPSHSLEPRDMYTSVFVYTTCGECDISNPAPGHGFTSGVVSSSARFEKGNEVQHN